MLQYDLSETKLFASNTALKAPSEAEMFVITAALLLIHEAAYSDLRGGEVALTAANVDAVAGCIEQRLPEFARDFEVVTLLRKRLQHLVGMRVRSVSPLGPPPAPQ